MNNNENIKLVDENVCSEANEWLVKFMQNGLNEERNELINIRKKLKISYENIQTLSKIMFFIGIGLIIIAFINYFFLNFESSNNNGSKGIESLVIGGLGLVDLITLFFNQPIERIHKLMGDMTQITIAVNSFQTQVSLRLLETDINKRETMGIAATHINEVAKTSIESIQMYFDGQKTSDTHKPTYSSNST